MSIPAPPSRTWQADLLTLWPQIERQTEFAVRKLHPSERDEARQSIFACVAVAYAQLAAQGRAALAFPGPLVAYGLRQYQAGRLIGGRMNSRDVGSRRWRQVSGQRSASLAECQETLALVDQRRAPPAEIACLRIDFAAWLGTLSARDRRLTRQLARGEETRHVAARFRLSAGRVMSRVKGAFGERLKSREPPQQKAEVALRCKLLNWFVMLDMPISIMI